MSLLFFSSTEPKAQVSFSEQNLSVVLHLLLQNHWANFNQTWHKASLGEVYSNGGPRPFPRGDNNEIVKIH